MSGDTMVAVRDLQVHFMLAWMGFAARREEPFVKALAGKERGFSEDEKVELIAGHEPFGPPVRRTGLPGLTGR